MYAPQGHEARPGGRGPSLEGSDWGAAGLGAVAPCRRRPAARRRAEEELSRRQLEVGLDVVCVPRGWPVSLSQIEGRGNGIKTNVVNNVEIAKALERPPECEQGPFFFVMLCICVLAPSWDLSAGVRGLGACGMQGTVAVAARGSWVLVVPRQHEHGRTAPPAGTPTGSRGAPRRVAWGWAAAAPPAPLAALGA